MIWTSLLSCPQIDLELKDENGRSALHVACWYNKVGQKSNIYLLMLIISQELAVSKFLSLESGRGMWNDTDQHGNTPVMMAAKYASSDVITLLLNNEEISLEAVDNLGRDLCSMIRSVQEDSD